MVTYMYDNDFKKKEKKIEMKDKFEPQHIYRWYPYFKENLVVNKTTRFYHCCTVTVTVFYFLAAEVKHND